MRPPLVIVEKITKGYKLIVHEVMTHFPILCIHRKKKVQNTIELDDSRSCHMSNINDIAPCTS